MEAKRKEISIDESCIPTFHFVRPIVGFFAASIISVLGLGSGGLADRSLA